MDTVIEFLISLFDAVLCVYFISRFNHASILPRKNKFAIPSIFVIFLFSVINDLFLTGFNTLATVIFLTLYIAYALLICEKKYVKAIFSACIFEIVFVLLSSLIYLIMAFLIKDYDELLQGADGGVLRYAYILIHKIMLFVVLKIILIAFNKDGTMAWEHGIISFLFSLTTVFGLGATMYLASAVGTSNLQIIIIILAFAFSNVALYVLIYQMQKYQQSKYELSLLQERMDSQQARLNDATLILNNVRKIQHDMKQHLTVISGYLEADSTEECKAYVNELLPTVCNIGNPISSDNAVLDYLINSKLAHLDDTKIVVSGSIGDLSDIKESDLACLIGNVLDNAVEAVQKIRKTKNKRIELLFLRQNSNRIIICKNTVERSVLQSNKELKTTKKSKDTHGYGTKIIAKIVSDYRGMVDYFEEFGMFGVQLILPEPD